MLQEFIQIRQLLKEPCISNNEVRGKLIFNKEIKPSLLILSRHECIEEFVKTSEGYKEIKELKDNGEIELSLFPLNLKDAYYYETFENLIQRSSQSFPDLKFYVNSLQFKSDKETNPPEIVAYKSFLSLIKCLVTCCDYQSDFNTFYELVFIAQEKVLIETKYSTAHLILLEKADDLYDQLENTNDKVERKKIFTTELISFIEHINEPDARFIGIIENFSTLYANYQKSHKFYLEQFSFHKIKTEFDEKKIEYAKKIREVLSSTQSKLIAVPIAFLLIASQFDLDGLLFGKNLSLMLSSIIFSILLTLLINNQENELAIISRDLLKFEEDFLTKLNSVKINDFNQSLDDLKKNCRKQKSRLNLILVMIWLVSVLSICLFTIAVYNNRPDWVTDIYHDSVALKNRWLIWFHDK